MLTLDLALAGLGIGAVAALAGLGHLVTHRLTGVFNLAFGAIAMFIAYLFWWAVRIEHWPIVLAAVVVLGVVAPALGLALDIVVYRPLQRRRAAPAELLAASVGVFVLLVGTAFAIWGGQPRRDAPSLVSSRVFEVASGAYLRLDTLIDLAAVAAVAVVAAVLLRTRSGRTVRAVVEGRELAELVGVNTARISAIGWAAGSFLAGLSGVLLAPTLSLDPYTLTLVVLETMAVAVIAGLSRPGIAIVAALVIGVGQSELTQFTFSGHAGQLHQALTTNLFVVFLFGALLLRRRLDEPGGGDAGTTSGLAVRREVDTPRGWWIAGIAVFAVPLMLDTANLRIAEQVPALAMILASIVVLSGYGGQISLGQAGFAGLGALLGAKLSAGQISQIPHVPAIFAFPVGALLVVPVGLLTSFLAVRRRGLFLALTTFAVGALIGRFVFAQPEFVTSVRIGPPGLFRRDDSFYAYELVCLGGALLLIRNLHRGRLGRALVAMRDNEAGARASGIDVPRLKLVVFAASAAIAGLGGALLAAGARAFDATTFDPVQSLLWFATVVVFGVDSASGAVIGAGVLVLLDSAAGQGISILAVGLAAVLLGRMPGGILFALRRSVAAVLPRDASNDPAPVRLSPVGLALADRLRR